MEELLITQNRRLLLSGVSVTYTVRVFDGTTSEHLMALLESSISQGAFLASLDINSGLLVESLDLMSVHDNNSSAEGNPSGYSRGNPSTLKGQLLILIHENLCIHPEKIGGESNVIYFTIKHYLYRTE